MRNGVLLYDYLGYDPEYRDWSPGTILQLLALERIFAERCHRIFDFTEGEGSHKELFASGSRDCADILFLQATARNQLVVRSHAALATGSRGMVNVLEILKIKAAIKRLIRSRA